MTKLIKASEIPEKPTKIHSSTAYCSICKQFYLKQLKHACVPPPWGDPSKEPEKRRGRPKKDA